MVMVVVVIVIVTVVVVVFVVAIGDEGVEGVVSLILLESSPRRLTLNVSFAPPPRVVEVMMVTVLVGSVAISLEIGQSPSGLLGVGVVAMTKDDDVLCAIVAAPIAASSVAAPFIWLEAIVDLVASTVPPISSFGPRFPVNVVQGAVSAGW